MIEVKVDLVSIDDLVKRIQEAKDDAALAMAQAIHEDADQRVPVSTGELKKSGRTESRPDGSAAVIYGNAKVNYALAVHESPSIEPRTGEKKWLRNASMEATKLLRIAAKRLEKVFK